MPLPKGPARRRRSNRTAGARTLRSVPGLKVPALPDSRPWGEETREWWWNVWTSPMAPEYVDADADELLILAVLVDAFWAKPSVSGAAEIRLQRQCFGLTPIGRRRLAWEMERASAAQERTAARRVPPRGLPGRGKDPRSALGAWPDGSS